MVGKSVPPVQYFAEYHFYKPSTRFSFIKAEEFAKNEFAQNGRTIPISRYNGNGMLYKSNKVITAKFEVLVNFMSEISDIPLIDGLGPFQVVSTSNQIEQLLSLIKKYKLNQFEDLIVLISGILTSTYVLHLHRFREIHRRKPKIPFDVEKGLHQVLSAKNERLLEINFTLSRSGVVKVKDVSTIRMIIKQLKAYFGDTQESLFAFEKMLKIETIAVNFHTLAAVELHNFLKGINAFDFKGKKTVEKELLFIAELLAFCHVTFYEKGTFRRYDISDKADLTNVKQQIKKAISAHLHNKEKTI